MTVPTSNPLRKTPPANADLEQQLIADDEQLIDIRQPCSARDDMYEVRILTKMRIVVLATFALVLVVLGISLIMFDMSFPFAAQTLEVGFKTVELPDNGQHAMMPYYVKVDDGDDAPIGHLQGMLAIPYENRDASAAIQMLGPLRQLNAETAAQLALFDDAFRRLDGDADRFFIERIDVNDAKTDDDDGVADEGFTRVTIPSFRDGREGKFVHDFNSNQSVIVDAEQRHCFVMPLDRSKVLLPRNIRDMFEKLDKGFYDIDMDVVQQRMRVVLPAIADHAELAPRVRSECADLEVYRLEPLTGRVFKRNAADLPSSAKFAHFSGHKVVEVDVVNYKDIDTQKTSAK